MDIRSFRREKEGILILYRGVHIAVARMRHCAAGVLIRLKVEEENSIDMESYNHPLSPPTCCYIACVKFISPFSTHTHIYTHGTLCNRIMSSPARERDSVQRPRELGLAILAAFRFNNLCRHESTLMAFDGTSESIKSYGYYRVTGKIILYISGL